MTKALPSQAIMLRLVLVAAAPTLMAACTTTRQVPVDVRSAIADPFTIEWVHAYPGKDGVVINGTVRRLPGTYGAIAGNVEVAALQADGSVITAKLVRWGPLASSGSRRASFAAHLPVPTHATVRSISVKYVAGQAGR